MLVPVRLLKALIGGGVIEETGASPLHTPTKCSAASQVCLAQEQGRSKAKRERRERRENESERERERGAKEKDTEERNLRR